MTFSCENMFINAHTESSPFVQYPGRRYVDVNRPACRCASCLGRTVHRPPQATWGQCFPRIHFSTSLRYCKKIMNVLHLQYCTVQYCKMWPKCFKRSHFLNMKGHVLIWKVEFNWVVPGHWFCHLPLEGARVPLVWLVVHFEDHCDLVYCIYSLKSGISCSKTPTLVWGMYFSFFFLFFID